MDVSQRIWEVGHQPLHSFNKESVSIKESVQVRELTNVSKVDCLDINSFNHLIHVSPCFQESHSLLISDGSDDVESIPIEEMSEIHIFPVLDIFEDVKEHVGAFINVLLVVSSVGHRINLSKRRSQISVLNIIYDREHAI